MTDTPARYKVEKTQVQSLGRLSDRWAVVRTDGTPTGWGPGKDYRAHNHLYSDRGLAEIVAAFLNGTPDDYRIERNLHKGRHFWLITGAAPGDPGELKSRTFEDDQKPADTVSAALIRKVTDHVAGIDRRVAAQADADAKAAEQEAEADRRRALEAEKGPLATPRQVDFIMELLADRQRTGDGGGFYFGGPTTRKGVAEMSKREASMYITSLKGDY
ncbi:hypothetical protein EDD29_0034 [Actinocorallia herbida]|uniref:Uncharacterized protein n=1 Tax=Actinocorallia herbida TaxID=58109 RepID=A0A3N1CN36_9ACTN|nr:hypothetical protein [Actinocorallia herbida]ROO82554.1 hypothetical protein EDD29_0034 [Actinocorallia herbida]